MLSSLLSFFLPRSLSYYGRYTFARQLPAEVLVGIGAQTALLGQFFLARIFQPSDTDIYVLFALVHVSFLLAPYVAEQIRGRPSQPFYTVFLLLGPGVFMLAAGLRGFWGIGPLFATANLAFVTLFVPLRNRLLRSNYQNHERGECYATFWGFSLTVYFGMMLAAAFALKRDATHIYWMLPVVGLLSGIGVWRLRSIKVRQERRRAARQTEARIDNPVTVYARLLKLFATERPFLRYEIGFTLYGIGFMFTVPREIDVVAKTLELGYDQIVYGVFGISPIARILVTRWFGRRLDQCGPYLTASTAFALLASYPLLVWASVATESVVVWYAARVAFGFAIAGIDLAWVVGPVHFGDAERAPVFSGAHIFMVGVRASIGPFLGLALASWLGSGIFGVSTAVLIGAALFMLSSHATAKREEAATRTP